MIKRSAAVVIAVTIQRLADGHLGGWTADQELVLAALRGSTGKLAAATDDELGAYVASLTPVQLRGVVSNVKGKFHELLVERAVNRDGDLVEARQFEASNHPGADLEFLMDGEVVHEVQLKAIQSPTAIIDHFAKYPEIDVMVTSEVFAALDGAFPGQVSDSRFSNAGLTATTEQTLADLQGEDLADMVHDGVVTSTLVAGALQARALLCGRAVDAAALRRALETAGIGFAAAVATESLLGAF
jgi:hypothetical protein